MHKGKARAYTNIALIKYWGKKDPQLILPMNSSLSLTLDAFYTETSVSFSDKNQQDQFYLDGQLQKEAATRKVTRFLDLVRKKGHSCQKAIVSSQNFVPTAAGLASSASGLAALAAACSQALELDLSSQELSRLARRGSGSACRSIYGGFVEWKKGVSDETSYAVPLSSRHWEDQLAMIFVLINDRPKEISSRSGMQQTVETSVYYPAWVESTEKDLEIAKQAIYEQDFRRLGEVTEASCLKMHASTLAADPPFTYWSPDSIRAMDIVHSLRKEGLACYFTMDAGPNVKVLCQKKEEQKIYQKLQQCFTADQLVIAHSGKGVENLAGEVSK